MASNVIKANNGTKCDDVTASENTASKAPVHKGNVTLTDADRLAFEALRLTIQTKGIENLELGPSPKSMIIVPTSNTGGNACRANIEPRIVNFANGGSDQTKASAVSALSLGLTRLRIRPGMTLDATIANVPKNEPVDKNPNKNASLVGSNLQQHMETAPGIKKDIKYTPSVAKGWKTNVKKDDGVESVDSKKPVDKMNDSSIVNIKEQVKYTPDKKNPGFQSVSSKIVHQNSNDGSLGSSFNNINFNDIYPKGFEVSHSSSASETSKGKQEDKTDVNKNVHKCENNDKGNVFSVKCNDHKTETRNNVYSLKLDANSNKALNILHSVHDLNEDFKAKESSYILHSLDECNTDTKSKQSIIQQKGFDKETLFKSNTGTTCSVSEHSKQPPEAGSDFAWIGKGKEETSKKSKSLDLGDKTHQPLGRAASSDSKPFVSASNSSGIKNHLGKFDFAKSALEAEKSNETSLITSINNQNFRHKMFSGSSKPSIETFEFHKQELENSAAQKTSQSSTTKNVEKDNRFGKSVIEGKQSFETVDIRKQTLEEQKEKISHIEKTVTGTIKKLNEPEAMTIKTEQIVSCCSQSLSSSSPKDESLNDDYALLPSLIQKDASVSLTTPTQKDNHMTLSSSIQKGNHVTLPSPTQKDVMVSLPSSVQKDDHVTLPPSIQKDNHVLLPSPKQKDNHVPLPSPTQKDNHVTLSSSIQKGNHVLLSSPIQKDDHVTLPSSIQKDNHMPLPLHSQKDNHVTLSSPSQNVDLGTLPSSIQKVELLSQLAKEDPQDLSETNHEPIYLGSFDVRIPDELSEDSASSEVDLIYGVIPAEQEEKDGVAYRKTFNVRVKQSRTEEQTKDAVFQPGPVADIDNNYHNSNSAIYGNVDQMCTRRAAIIELANFDNDRDMLDVPPLRGTKDEETENRFRDPYKGKTVDKETDLKSGVGMDVSSQSAMFSVTKFLKGSKSSLGTNLDAADNDYHHNSRESSFENSEEEFSKVQQKIITPPLPPKDSELYIDMSDILLPKDVLNSSSRNLDCRSDRSSPPPLPTHQMSHSFDLNMVIPVPPGCDKKSAANGSYLHGQVLNISSAISESVSSHSFTSPNDAPTYPQRPLLGGRSSNPSTDSYVDVGEMNKLMKSEGLYDSYVDVGDFSLPDTEYLGLDCEIRDEDRPISSAYIREDEIATIPLHGPGRLGRAPFEDILNFYSPYEEDCQYVDLSDDQIYGTGRRYTSKLESSSLYQFYNKDTISRASQQKAVYSNIEVSDNDDEDLHVEDERIYEDMSGDFLQNSCDIEKVAEAGKSVKLSTLDIFGKTGTVMRALWSEMPEVKKSGVLASITPQERKLQESMFEIITSEATYLKSLNVLIDVFLLSEEFGCKLLPKCVITKQQQHVIFSNIGLIRDTSERFLLKLESRWQESVLLSDICDIIAEHSEKYFECYVHYCSNQVFQDRAVTDLKKKPDFADALRRLEAKPECQGLPMISFLLLPMQRITRLPLLVDAICHRLVPEKDEKWHKSAVNAFRCLSKVVRRCNDGAKLMQQTEQMFLISKQIEFSANKAIANIPLLSASRYLVKQGELLRITNEAGSRIPFGKAKHGKKVVHVFLFNDLLVITKKKGERYVVCDHAQRNSLHAEELSSPEKCSKYLPFGVPNSCKFLFLLVMLENHDKKQVEAVFSCNSESDRTRWVDIVTPFKVMDHQRIYEEWDCPQVQCIKPYIAHEPDELTLEESDVVNVYKKLEDDGMYEGERLRDGEKGWFPKDHTLEIQNSHVRARNMRMKYRMLAAADIGNKTSN